MGWDRIGYATRIEGKMDADLHVSIMEDGLQESLHYYNKTSQILFFSRTITLNTPAGRHRTGSKTMGLVL